jgi:hypothetical protein
MPVSSVYSGEIRFIGATGNEALVYEKYIYDTCYGYPYYNGYRLVRNPALGACKAVGDTISYAYCTGFTCDSGSIGIAGIN